MLTTWGVVLELESLDGPDPVASARRAFALGRDAYLARRPVLRPANGRATLAIVRDGAGERMEIPRPVRDECIPIQLSARDLG